MNVVALQLDIAWEDPAANFAKVQQLLARHAPLSNSLVILPEMFSTGFSMNTEVVAEAYGGTLERFLSETAKSSSICLLAGAAMRGKDGAARNKALAFGPDGRLLAFYAKMRLFSPGGESLHYVAGTKTVGFRWSNCVISPFICYDLRFPELFRAAVVEHRPELFVVIANFPQKRVSHWVRLLQARAIENQAFVVGVNRVGSDPYYSYNGRSVIVDPQGDILVDAGEVEGAISAQLDLDGLRKYRTGLPFLEDMRLERKPGAKGEI